MRELAELRLRFALPFSVLPGPGSVLLVFGEDVRFLLEAPELDTWLPALLASLDGRRRLRELVEALPAERREEGKALIVRLLGERVLTEAEPIIELCRRPRLAISGEGRLAEALRERAPAPASEGAPTVRVLCQGDLDYARLVRFNAESLAGEDPFLWVSTGPVARGFVGPLCLPDAGPCLECLLGAFRRLSPTPEVYGALLEAEPGRALPAETEFPEHGRALLVELALRKLELALEPLTSSTVHLLHVFECSTLEVSSHRVALDPECGACGGLR
ncbi:MAG: TOMM precursor leader peptide-binding protein [Polyangiaceae bacterium]